MWNEEKSSLPAKNVYLYHFQFKDGDSREFTIELNSQTGYSRIPDDAVKLAPSWTQLEFHKCRICPLKSDKHKHCPVALQIYPTIESFKDKTSHEEVKVTVTTNKRVISNILPLQNGVSSLLGLLMATSGCPISSKFKPLAQYHLPFAGLYETVFRVGGMFFWAQYFRNKHKKVANWDLNDLVQIYTDLYSVNVDMIKRIKAQVTGDANQNAIVILSTLPTLFPKNPENLISKLEYQFDVFLEDLVNGSPDKET